MALVLATLAARPLKDGWRATAHDRFKRVFHMTERQIPIVERLIAAGGGQLLWLRYGASSTLAMLAGAVDPTLHAEIAGDDAPMDLDERARAIFDRMPHRHPRGSVPDWERQPEHLRDVFRGFARGDAPIPR
jgi:hypothetical protein